MSTVSMAVPSGSPLESYNLPGGTYTPSGGVIAVALTDVPFALAAGCVPVLTAVNPGIATSTAAAGTSQGTAGALPSGGGVYPTTASNGTNGVVLAAADVVVGRMIFITNPVASQPLIVYPPTGYSSTINAGAANAAYSSASAKGALLICLSGTPTSTSTWMAL